MIDNSDQGLRAFFDNYDPIGLGCLTASRANAGKCGENEKSVSVGREKGSRAAAWSVPSRCRDAHVPARSAFESVIATSQ